MKLFFKKGGVHFIAQAKANPEVFYFTTAEQDAHTFSGINEILDLLVAREFFKIQVERFHVQLSDRVAFLLTSFEAYRNCFKGCGVPALSDKLNKKILNSDCFEPDQDTKKKVVNRNLFNNMLEKDAGRPDLMIGIGNVQPLINSFGDPVVDSAPERKPKKPAVKKVQKGLGSKNTNNECIDQIAAFYGIRKDEVHTAIQDLIKGKEGAVPAEESTVSINNIDEAFCLAMSEKIRAFITDPARRNLIAIMGIEKAAGIPTSTISNFISAKRDRIPLHHIGAIVRTLEAVGFRA